MFPATGTHTLLQSSLYPATFLSPSIMLTAVPFDIRGDIYSYAHEDAATIDSAPGVSIHEAFPGLSLNQGGRNKRVLEA